MNKVINPLVSLLLRSPLHGILSSSVLLFSYRGKKTGKEYTLPVQFVQQQDKIIIVPGNPEQKTWWRNLRGGYPVRLVLRGKHVSAQARLLKGETATSELEAALRMYLERFPAAARMHQVDKNESGRFNPTMLLAAARSMVIVQVDLLE